MRVNTAKMKVILILFLIFLLWAKNNAYADDPSTDLTELPIEELMKIEVVYAASKFEQKVTEAPSSVSITTADEIKKYGYRTLADILQSVRGFYISYDRNYKYVGVRGFARPGDYNTRVLMLLDGHRINDNIYGHGYIGTDFHREKEIVKCVEEGLAYKEIAEKLNISPHTVHTHIKKIYEKLQAKNRQEAISTARKKGII